MLVLDGGEWLVSWPRFAPGKWNPAIYLIRSWVDPRAGMRALEGGEISFSGLELKQTPDSQAYRQAVVPIMIPRLTSSEINFILWSR